MNTSEVLTQEKRFLSRLCPDPPGAYSTLQTPWRDFKGHFTAKVWKGRERGAREGRKKVDREKERKEWGKRRRKEKKEPLQVFWEPRGLVLAANVGLKAPEQNKRFT